MIFPNHPDYAEIRAGMGYQPGAHALLGYQPGAHALLGYTAPTHTLGYSSGAYGAMGDFSASMENAAIDAGISVNDIDLLNSLGATDQDLSDLINGNATLAQVYAKYGVTIPGGGGVAPTTATTPASASVTPSAPAAASAPAWSAPGSTLIYQVRWNPGYGDLTVSTNSAAANLAKLLGSHGMNLVSYQQGGAGLTTYQLTCTILDMVGHAQQQDVLSVLNALMQQTVGNNLAGSSVSVSVSGESGGSIPSNIATVAAISDPVAWLENNAIYIGGAVLALILVNNFTGGKRR
jgi:hypothetical protein